MKKILLFFVAAMLVSVVRAADGDDFTYEGLKYRILSETEHQVQVAGYERASGDLTIPTIVTNKGSRYVVVSIRKHAFNGCRSLSSVTIPSSVTSIEDNAFGECSSLTSVTIPNSVTSIGEYAFGACSSLTSVTIPSSVTSISKQMFSYCISLTSVTIPNSVTSIGEYAFSGCSSLTSVTIPNSVTSIGEVAFGSCSSLTSVAIPNSVTSIGEYAFSGCSSLTSVTIPNSVTSIGEIAFGGCSSLTEINVEEGNNKYCIQNGILYDINMTTLIQCPAGQTGQTDIQIPGSVTSIGWNAFEGCSSLTSVTIPNSVTSIGGNAFMGCSSLTSVAIPNSVISIGWCAFDGCSSLTSVTIPNSVASIEWKTFGGCSNLTSVTIPNSVTSIGRNAFEGCISLTSVTIPNSVTSIDGSAFTGCSSLTKIVDLNPVPQETGSVVLGGIPSNAVIYIPKGSFMKYLVANGWTRFTDFREMGALDLSLSVNELELKAGESTEITVTVDKDGDMTIESEEWSTSNPEVSTVDGGKVTAVAEGTAIISYTVTDGYGVPHTESCKVTVAAPAILVESITLDRTAIEAEEGTEIRLIATVTPDNATNKEIAWFSSDETVATVSAEGLVKVLKAGNCVITAAITDGSGIKAECSISVLSGIDAIFVDASASFDVYTLQGAAVLHNAKLADVDKLPAGLYIVRQGNVAKKVAVK